MEIFTNRGHHATGKVSQRPVIVMVRPRAQLPADDTRGHGRDELVEILLQVQGLVLQQRLHHPHEVDEDGEVVLHHVDSDPLGDEGAESGQHLVQPGVTRQGLERLCPPRLVRAHARLRDLLVVELLLHAQLVARQLFHVHCLHRLLRGGLFGARCCVSQEAAALARD